MPLPAKVERERERKEGGPNLKKDLWRNKWNLDPGLHVREVACDVVDDVRVVGRVEAGCGQHYSVQAQMGRPRHLLLEGLRTWEEIINVLILNCVNSAQQRNEMK